MNREKVNEWLENTFSEYRNQEDRKESIFYLLKRLQDNHDKEISRLLLEIQDAKNEIFRLNCSSCSNCNHWISETFSTNKNDLKGFCSLFGICNGDLSHDMSNDFCCNKWQNKE